MSIEELRKEYKAFQKGSVDPLILKKKLVNAIEKETDPKIIRELEDMLLDVYLSLEDIQDDLLTEDEEGKRTRYTGKYKGSRRGKG